MRFLWRMHGLLPHRSIDEQVDHPHGVRKGPEVEAVAVEELEKLPVFKGVSGTFLSLNRGAVVSRHFKRGEIICREGEYGPRRFISLKARRASRFQVPLRT